MKPTPIWKFLQAICRVVTSLVFNLKVYGSDRVPKTGGLLLISNHQSNLDAIILFKLVRQDFTTIAKKEISSKPVLAQFMWLAPMDVR